MFDNTNKKEFSLIDDKSTIKILKEGEGKVNGPQDTENKYIFKGDENSIEYKRFYSQEFECEFGLQWYPFDTQNCHLDIVPSTDLRDVIKFVNDKFIYEGPLDLTEYNVKKIEMKVNNVTMLRVNIFIQRRLLSLVLTAFIPTIILNLMGHMSNYFKEFFFEAIISLNITVMLALTTIFLRWVYNEDYGEKDPETQLYLNSNTNHLHFQYKHKSTIYSLHQNDRHLAIIWTYETFY